MDTTNKSTKKFLQEIAHEKIWGILFLIFSGVALYIIRNVYLFFTLPQSQTMVTSSLDDLTIIVPVAIFTWVYREVFTFMFKEKFIKYIDEVAYPTLEEKTERAFVLCKFILDIAYYTFSSLATYYILKDADFLPWSVFGKGDIMKAVDKNFPKIVILPHVKFMYLLQIGYHLYSFFYQVLMKRKDKKYLEFVLHHGLTIFLMGFSYCTNFINLGTIVLMIHDCSDALLSLARALGYLNARNSIVSSLVYVVAIFMWIYTRLFVFPIYCIWPTYLQYLAINEDFKELFKPMVIFFLAMLCTLLVMHVYWTITLVKAVLDYFIKKSIKVDYNGIRKKT